QLRRCSLDPRTAASALPSLAGAHRTYVGRLERGESGVTVDTLAAIFSSLSISLAEFFRPFTAIFKPTMPRRRYRTLVHDSIRRSQGRARVGVASGGEARTGGRARQHAPGTIGSPSAVLTGKNTKRITRG